MGGDGTPHYHGHRERLRERFAEVGGDAMPDYELLELVLFRSIPRRDVKPIAKELIRRFGSFAETLAAPPARLLEVDGIGESVVQDLKVVEAAARRMAKGAVRNRPVLSSWSAVLDYCRTAMAFSDREQFRLLFLDKRNALIADEVQGQGTVDHTPVYPREVVKRALELSATALILVHNHPSGDPTPSSADVKMTRNPNHEELLAFRGRFTLGLHRAVFALSLKRFPTKWKTPPPGLRALDSRSRGFDWTAQAAQLNSEPIRRIRCKYCWSSCALSIAFLARSRRPPR